MVVDDPAVTRRMLCAVGPGQSSGSVGGANGELDEAEAEEHGEEDYECIPCEQGDKAIPRRHPGDPTEKEVREHNLTHCPFRSWCPICAEAQGKEDPHYRSIGAEVNNEAPVVSMDYKELSEYSTDKAKINAIVGRDKWTKYLVAFIEKAKGSIERAKKIVELLDTFGYADLVLKLDNEAAIKTLRDEVISKRNRPTMPANSVPRHPQTHGVAERAVQEFTGQVRKIKFALEKRINAKVPVTAPIMHWAVKHAALLINRQLLGHDGKTAYRRVHQRDSPPIEIEFGEQVLARFAPKRSKAKRKIPPAPRSTPGTWVGIHEPTIDNIVILESGRAVRVRTVFRKFDEERWNADQVLKAQAIPSSPNPSSPDEEMSILKPEPDNSSCGANLPDTPSVPQKIKYRNFKATKRLLDAHGYIDGCVGCEAAETGGARRSHSVYCRKRIAEELYKIAEGKKIVEKAQTRFGTPLEKIGDHPGSCEEEGDGAELPAPEHLEDEDRESSDDTESGDDSEDVVAWLNKCSNDGCSAEDIKEMIRRLEHSCKQNEHVQSTVQKTSNDVSEVYSPPRIAARVVAHGLRPGFSLDLIEQNSEGKFWDFSSPSMRKEALIRYEREQPEMLVLSPMCGPFSQLQGLNYSKMRPDDAESKLREGITHLKFSMTLCKMQSDKTRLFIFEHPQGARSWSIDMVKAMMELPGVVIVDFDFCQFGMTSIGLDGEGPVKKRIKIMTKLEVPC